MFPGAGRLRCRRRRADLHAAVPAQAGPDLSRRVRRPRDSPTSHVVADAIEATLTVPAPRRGEPTIVERRFPVERRLARKPAEVLHSFFRADEPRRQLSAYSLLDAAGAPVECAVPRIGGRIVGRSGRRLTLLLDPGRVKHDLKPHKEVGRAIVDGQTYTLPNCRRLARCTRQNRSAEFRKKFRVTKADVRQPDPKRWQLTVAACGNAPATGCRVR